MSLSGNDRRFLARVRRATGAKNESQIPPHVLEDELERAKAHLSEEIKESLESGTFNFHEDAAEDALYNLLCLRIWSRARGRNAPRTVSHIRRHDFEDSQANFWRDELVRALNRVTE